MDTKVAIQEFLVARRNRITPEESGLPFMGAKRRVPGLRREEVAMLAGVSVDYYVKLERGNLEGASESVLLALAKALQLDDTETSYLMDLAKASRPMIGKIKTAEFKNLRPNLELILSTVKEVPAFIRNTRMDLLGATEIGQALYSPIIESKVAKSNFARWVFLDADAKNFYANFEKIAEDTVGVLRRQTIKQADDPKLHALIGELSSKSELFRVLWAHHKVMVHRGGKKTFNHPVIGEISLSYEPLQIVADENLLMTIYTAEPGSDSAEKLQLLGTWWQTQKATVVHKVQSEAR